MECIIIHAHAHALRLLMKYECIRNANWASKMRNKRKSNACSSSSSGSNQQLSGALKTVSFHFFSSLLICLFCFTFYFDLTCISMKFIHLCACMCARVVQPFIVLIVVSFMHLLSFEIHFQNREYKIILDGLNFEWKSSGRRNGNQWSYNHSDNWIKIIYLLRVDGIPTVCRLFLQKYYEIRYARI